jgi:lipooligosaccharide transport system permease protein
MGLAFSLAIRSVDLFSFYFTLFLTPLFLFSDVFFPLGERLSGGWLLVAEALPLLHPVRLFRAAFRGDASWILLWDVAYTLLLSTALLALASRLVRRRLAG